MATSRHPNREALTFIISATDAQLINALSAREGSLAGDFVIDTLTEAGVTGIPHDRKRSTTVGVRIRVQLPTQCVHKILTLAAVSHPTVSAWARHILMERFVRIQKKAEARSPVKLGVRKLLYHPITGMPWLPVPFQGDSRWPQKYFQETSSVLR